MASLHTLKNGVRVVCDPMPGLETIALSVVAGRGARAEDGSRSGWSHLLEHMVFKGAGSRTAKAIVESIEAEGGQINAATGYERTSYQVRALAGGLDLGSAVLADLIQRPHLDATDLEREKQVVGQEIAEAADTPDDLIFEMAQTAAFEGQSLGSPVLGTDTSIAPATPSSLNDWRTCLYGAETLVFSASGAVDTEEVLAIAERDFGEVPRAVAPSPVPAEFTGGVRTGAKKLEQANLVLLLPGVGVGHPSYFAMRLFAEMLGGGMASRLFQEAREKRGLAYAVDAYAESYHDTGVLGIFAGCAAKDTTELVKVAAGEVVSLLSDVSAGELSRAKAQLKSGLFMARESPLARAEQAAGQVLLFGRLLTSAEIAQQIDAVEATDISALSDIILKPRRSVAAVLGPRPSLKAAEVFQAALA